MSDIEKFVNSLGGVLAKFASNNPYPFYKNLLVSIAIPNSKLLGNLVILGEAFTAFSLLIASFYFLFKEKDNKFFKILMSLGLLQGLILNLNFWLASAWTSPSADSLNLLMFLIELIGLFYITGNKFLLSKK